eukprot:TRINITY_DN57376_c0_g1_i1.p1 TRINITY_DN57376_c0_g1~~TRINITY_DN57376_c0_g1_i1.p1  ORF type:complete len:810 (-),score=104.71 TRINITY_DN57376_c0_g1_i1:14-2209(-)
MLASLPPMNPLPPTSCSVSVQQHSVCSYQASTCYAPEMMTGDQDEYHYDQHSSEAHEQDYHHNHLQAAVWPTTMYSSSHSHQQECSNTNVDSHDWFYPLPPSSDPPPFYLDDDNNYQSENYTSLQTQNTMYSSTQSNSYQQCTTSMYRTHHDGHTNMPQIPVDAYHPAVVHYQQPQRNHHNALLDDTKGMNGAHCYNQGAHSDAGNGGITSIGAGHTALTWAGWVGDTWTIEQHLSGSCSTDGYTHWCNAVPLLSSPSLECLSGLYTTNAVYNVLQCAAAKGNVNVLALVHSFLCRNNWGADTIFPRDTAQLQFMLQQTSGQPSLAHLAAFNGHVNVLEWITSLYTYEMDATQTLEQVLEGLDEHGCTVLLAATLGNRLEVVQWLVQEHHCDVKATNKAGHTPLIVAAAAGHLGIVQWLLTLGGSSVSESDTVGNTALMWASFNNHSQVVKECLLRHFYLPPAYSPQKSPPYSPSLAITNSSPSSSSSGPPGEWWADHYCDADTDSASEYSCATSSCRSLPGVVLEALRVACIRGHLETVQCLVCEAPTDKLFNTIIITAMEYAAINSQNGIVEWLIMYENGLIPLLVQYFLDEEEIEVGLIFELLTEGWLVVTTTTTVDTTSTQLPHNKDDDTYHLTMTDLVARGLEYNKQCIVGQLCSSWRVLSHKHFPKTFRHYVKLLFWLGYKKHPLLPLPPELLANALQFAPSNAFPPALLGKCLPQKKQRKATCT